MRLARLQSCSFAFILLSSAIVGTASALPIQSAANGANATYSVGVGAYPGNDSSLSLDGRISAQSVIGVLAIQVSSSSDPRIDAGSPTSASFSMRLTAIPTTMAVYSLDSLELDGLDPIRGASDDRANAAWTAWLKHRIRRFPGTAVPEPSAAILFGVGLVVAHASLRRRR